MNFKYLKNFHFVNFVMLGLFSFFAIHIIENQFKKQVIIPRSALIQAVANHQISTNSKISKDELRIIKEKLIYDELLYQKAIELGLDQNDYIIRARLIQKIKNLALDINGFSETPNRAELLSYFNNNKEKYKQHMKIKFHHVFLGADFDSHNGEQNFIGKNLNQFSIEELRKIGKSFPLGSQIYGNVQQLKSTFGDQFLSSIKNSRPLVWQGPYQSKFGYHYVLISLRVPEKNLDFNQVARKVVADYRALKKKRSIEHLVTKLKNESHVSFSH